MRNEIHFAANHPSMVILHPRRSWAYVKAMREFIKENPVCNFSGKPAKIVHHVQPVHVRPDLAADKRNMVGFATPKIHLIAGHGGNFKKWVVNVRELKADIRQNINHVIKPLAVSIHAAAMAMG